MSDDRMKAMKFERPDYIPVSVGLLPATWIRHREHLEEIILRHPVIFGDYKKGSRNFDEVGGTYRAGEHKDAWGCLWSNVAHGAEAYVTFHPCPRREDVRRLKAPAERTGLPHGFMYMRLFYLRGFEELMVDFAEEPPELRMLIDLVLAHNVKELEQDLAEAKGPGVRYFGDDLGMQDRLPISPAKWRKHLKPCFAKLYGLCHARGHDVYMHSDGHYWEIIPDLVECGVNVINPQIRANGLDNLVRVCKGKVCVSLDLDRQMFPFCTPADIDAHIREAVVKLGSPKGGLWLQAECGPDVPLQNIEAICRALEDYRGYYR